MEVRVGLEVRSEVFEVLYSWSPYQKQCIKEIIFILVNKWAVNITNFIHEDLPFFKK